VNHSVWRQRLGYAPGISSQLANLFRQDGRESQKPLTFRNGSATGIGMSTKQTAQAYTLGAGQGVPGFGEGVKASVGRTAGAFTLIESTTAGGAPWHVHTREDEYFYVLEGKVVVWCGEDEFHAGPGSFVFLPRGIPHSWDVESEGKAKLLMMTVPGMLEEFLREFHAATGPQRNEVARKYGLTFFSGKPPMG
jgi:quercetin dioxygenase-like cupin family protein